MVLQLLNTLLSWWWWVGDGCAFISAGSSTTMNCECSMSVSESCVPFVSFEL